MAKKNKGNLKAKKSKIKIRKALLHLMEEIPYDDITISKLAETAGLSRRTFYRNYSSKDDIINEFYMKLWSEYNYELSQQDKHSLSQIALVFFNKMKEYEDILQLFNKNDLFVLFLNSTPDLMVESYKNRDKDLVELSAEARKFVARFVSGGFFMVAKAWFENGQIESPEELAAYVEKMNLIY